MKNKNRQFGLHANIESFPNKEKGIVFTRYSLYSFRYGIGVVGEAKAKLAPNDEWDERIGRAASTARAKRIAMHKYYRELVKIQSDLEKELDYIAASHGDSVDLIESIMNGTFGKAKGSV